ncbi:hypothetical protein H4219_004795 [Mycoemilia scoparia]|uniref:Uncharacterized protein n=1 Tax=Mycoemilia scoparia TaxID=417184 RepID=A0A9W7ZV67_9FUNG|nr:hypothetical protein H4219_004795 [Mycoemilia scoparia]
MTNFTYILRKMLGHKSNQPTFEVSNSMNRSPPPVIGIDLGTTTISYANFERDKITSTTSFPAWINDDTRVNFGNNPAVGEKAKQLVENKTLEKTIGTKAKPIYGVQGNVARTCLETSLFEMKKLASYNADATASSNVSETTIRATQKYWPFQVVTVTTTSNSDQVDRRRVLAAQFHKPDNTNNVQPKNPSKKFWKYSDVLTCFLKKIRSNTKGVSNNSAVFSLPLFFDNKFTKEDIRHAAKKTGFRSEQFIHEPLAGLMGYNYKHRLFHSSNIVVIKFDSLGTQVMVADIIENKIKVKALGYDTEINYTVMIDQLYNYFDSMYKNNRKMWMDAENRDFSFNLHQKCEQMVALLINNSSSSISSIPTTSIGNDHQIKMEIRGTFGNGPRFGDYSLPLHMTKQKFLDMIQEPILDKLQDLVKEVISHGVMGYGIGSQSEPLTFLLLSENNLESTVGHYIMNPIKNSTLNRNVKVLPTTISANYTAVGAAVYSSQVAKYSAQEIAHNQSIRVITEYESGSHHRPQEMEEWDEVHNTYVDISSSIQRDGEVSGIEVGNEQDDNQWQNPRVSFVFTEDTNNRDSYYTIGSESYKSALATPVPKRINVKSVSSQTTEIPSDGSTESTYGETSEQGFEQKSFRSIYSPCYLPGGFGKN